MSPHGWAFTWQLGQAIRRCNQAHHHCIQACRTLNLVLGAFTVPLNAISWRAVGRTGMPPPSGRPAVQTFISVGAQWLPLQADSRGADGTSSGVNAGAS